MYTFLTANYNISTATARYSPVYMCVCVTKKLMLLMSSLLKLLSAIVLFVVENILDSTQTCSNYLTSNYVFINCGDI